MECNTIKVGNLIYYMGNLRDYYHKVAEVISIDKTFENKDSFVLKVIDWHKKEHEFRAYMDEIWPITLDSEHLMKLGFTKAEDKNVFSLGTLILIRPLFITYGNHGDTLIDKGFVVVEKGLKLNFTEEEVDAATTPVTYLHSLQNYFTDKLHKEIDWSIFK